MPHAKYPSNAALVGAEPIGNGRYQPTAVIGSGTYGCVLRCTDLTTRNEVAIKVSHSRPAFRRAATTEVNVLKQLENKPCIVKVLNSFDEDNCIHLVCELMHRNLYELLREDNFSGMQLAAVRHVARVVLTALQRLHEIGYIHCDIKPENVMVRNPNNQNDICVIDFGSVRRFTDNKYFDIQSMWYRAPEVICGLEYNQLIDVWSVGCLLVELQSGQPLFPGENPQAQLTQIIDMLGSPSPQAINQGKYSSTLSFTGSCADSDTCGLHSKVKGCGVEVETFVDFVTGMLSPSENTRWTVSECLEHPFLTGAPFEGLGAYNASIRPIFALNASITSSCGMSSSASCSPQRYCSSDVLDLSSADPLVLTPSQFMQRAPPMPVDEYL